MNFLSVATDADVSAQLEWGQSRQERDHAEGMCRTLLDAAWRAANGMQGAELVRLAATLRNVLHSNSFRPHFPDDEVETLLALGKLWEDDVEEAMTLAQDILARGGAARYRAVLATIMKWGYWRTRNFMPFYELSSKRAAYGNAVSQLLAAINLSIEAAAEAEQLRFKLAEHLARDALHLCSQAPAAESCASLLPTCVLAHLHYEAGAVDEADLLLRGRLAAIDESGAVESALMAYPLSCKVAAAKGNENLALLLLQRGEEVGMRQAWHRLVLHCKAEEVALRVRQGRTDLAAAALQQSKRYLAGLDSHRQPCGIHLWPLRVAALRLHMTCGADVHVVRSWQALRSEALQHNHPALVVKATILLSGALHASGQPAKAGEELLAALHQGANTGLFRSFLDELPHIEAPLRQLRRAADTRSLGHLRLYVGRLLAAPSETPPARKKFRSNHRLVESLSTRETTILRLMSLGLSNKAIARELRVTPETVKSHAKHIFIKLASKNRAEAVSRAAELGLM